MKYVLFLLTTITAMNCLMKSCNSIFALLLLLMIWCIAPKAQTSFYSEHNNELQRQRLLYDFPVQVWDSLRCAWYGECRTSPTTNPSTANFCTLNKRMFGWHMIGTSSASYQWTLMTDLSYFNYDIDPATGNAKNPTAMSGFASDATVLAALSNGVKVNLCAALFNNSTEFSVFFASATAQSNCITNLVNHVVAANATGINIDFEGSGLSSTYLTAFSNFMSNLSAQLHAAIPGAELSIDLQGAYANSASLLSNLLSTTDLFILMGYDYYWGGQFYPGPVAPTYQFPAVVGDPYGHGNVSNDLNNLIKNVGTAKTILAMPYYGRRWATINGCVIPATGNATSPSSQTYAQYRQNSNGYYTTPYRDTNSLAAYHCFDAGATPNQQFMDDTISLQKKYNLVRQRGIAGVAVWKLGNDAGYMDCWNLVDRNLSLCAVTPLTDTIYDMGGYKGNYHNSENYTFSIAPPGATAVQLNFLNFDLEANFDSLIIYDGSNTAAPLLAALTGASLPVPVTSSGPIMTLRFHSDGATVKTGFRAVYSTIICASMRKTIASGNFNNPAIWECGILPSLNDSVEISAGHTVNILASTQIKYLRIRPSASVSIANPLVTLTIGADTKKTSQLVVEGSLSISNGTCWVNGKLQLMGNYSFNLTGGKLTIDGNTGVASTSIADGETLFVAAAGASSFVCNGGILQFVNPALGSNSEIMQVPYNFTAGNTLLLGDGASTVISNNSNGFGGNGYPDTIGKLILDAATVGNNRILKVIKPLTVQTNCEVKSGNLIQQALITVSN